PSSSSRKITFCTLPEVARPSSLSMFPVSLTRFVGDGIHLDLAADDGARFHRGAGDVAVGKVLLEDAVVAAEVARILEVDGDAHHVGKVGAGLLEDAADGLQGPARLLLDVADAHVALLVLRHLAGDEDEV